MEHLTEKIKAIREGFIRLFVFADGMLYCELNHGKGYVIKDSSVKPMPCRVTDEIVYRITTPDGIMGYAVLLPDNNSD